MFGAECSSVVERLFVVRWLVRSIPPEGPIDLTLVLASAPSRFNKGHGMYCPVCGMVYIKDRLMLFGKTSS